MSDYLYPSMGDCLKAGNHCRDVDNDGFCNACGHEPQDGDKCATCSEPEHDTCALDPNCPCCRDTMERMT